MAARAWRRGQQRAEEMVKPGAPGDGVPGVNGGRSRGPGWRRAAAGAGMAVAGSGGMGRQGTGRAVSGSGDGARGAGAAAGGCRGGG